MKILRFLEAAPHADPISDPETVSKDYKYWRLRIFYSMFIGYAFFYFTRKSFTFAMPAMINELGFTKGELGVLATILSLTYGLSKFLSGILSDRSNARYFMAIGLILTGVLNICFGLSSSLVLFALFWGLNGWFQGWGWPPVARLLTHWYSQNERGRWWSSWNVSHNIGGALIPLLVGYLVFFGWRYALFIPGIMCIIVGLFLLNRLRDTPQSLGLPPIEKFRDDYPESKAQGKEDERELTSKEILIEYVIKNPAIWLLSFAYFFVYVVRIGVNDWSALFLMEERGYDTGSAIFTMSLFEVGGFFGSLAAGWCSDYFFQAKRGPINVLFSLGMLFVILLFWRLPHTTGLVYSTLMFAIGFLVFGPQMMIGVACAELSHKKAAATATGFAGWFAYMGAAFAGYPLGYLAQEYGWNGFFWAMFGCCAVSFLLLLPLWGAKDKKLELKPKTA